MVRFLDRTRAESAEVWRLLEERAPLQPENEPILNAALESAWQASHGDAEDTMRTARRLLDTVPTLRKGARDEADAMMVRTLFNVTAEEAVRLGHLERDAAGNLYVPEDEAQG